MEAMYSRKIRKMARGVHVCRRFLPLWSIPVRNYHGFGSLRNIRINLELIRCFPPFSWLSFRKFLDLTGTVSQRRFRLAFFIFFLLFRSVLLKFSNMPDAAQVSSSRTLNSSPSCYSSPHDVPT